MLKKITLTLLFMTVAHVSFAAPSITGVSGNVSHGSTVTITGAGFGFKNPASPLVWDDGSSNPSLSTYYDAWLPTNAQQGSQYNMAYRTVPFRGVGAPHRRINYILGGAHATDAQAGSYNIGGNVGIGKNTTSHEYFISYYYRVDPLFDEHNNPALGENMKEFVLSGVAGEFYINDFPPGHGYIGWCGSDVPDVNYSGQVKFQRLPINPANQNAPYSCSGNNLVYHDNPITGWVQMQWEGNYNYTYNSPQVSVTTYPDGRKTYQSHYGDPITVSEAARGFYPGYPKLNELRFIGLGGFARVPRMSNGVNSFRYFAAVYMDSTHARVMLGDKPDYNTCTIMEPQIPSAWSDGSIQMKINIGALPDSGTAYLFVFDSNGLRNARGFPVTIGASGGDTVPPAAPLGLRDN